VRITCIFPKKKDAMRFDFGFQAPFPLEQLGLVTAVWAQNKVDLFSLDLLSPQVLSIFFQNDV
jgi:hypothetical protein